MDVEFNAKETDIKLGDIMSIDCVFYLVSLPEGEVYTPTPPEKIKLVSLTGYDDIEDILHQDYVKNRVKEMEWIHFCKLRHRIVLSEN